MGNKAPKNKINVLTIIYGALCPATQTIYQTNGDEEKEREEFRLKVAKHNRTAHRFMSLQSNTVLNRVLFHVNVHVVCCA